MTSTLRPIQTVRPCTSAELVVTDATRAQVFWCLRRYASLAYARRTAELLRRFLGGFEAWARTSTPDRTLFARRVLRSLSPFLAAYEEFPGELLAGRATRAYAALERATDLKDITGRAFEDGMVWIEFGYGENERPSTGLFAWAERAMNMALRSRLTLDAAWAYSRILSDGPPERFRPRRFPPRLDPLPDPSGPTVDVGQAVPVTGVWIPIDVENGCPNFLVEGRPAPALTVESKRVDLSVPQPDGPPLTRTEYVYGTTSTRWRLAWEDTRYRAGVEPDEAEFLDEDNDFPADPPVHPPPP